MQNSRGKLLTRFAFEVRAAFCGSTVCAQHARGLGGVEGFSCVLREELR